MKLFIDMFCYSESNVSKIKFELLLPVFQIIVVQIIMCGYRGGGWGGGGGGAVGPDPPPPLENYKNIGFLSNASPDPLKITKEPIQHSMLGHHRPASEMPFKWRFAGGSLIARLWWYLDPSSPHQTKKKTLSKLDPPLTKLSGSAHELSRFRFIRAP